MALLIHVEEDALHALKSSLTDAGEGYKSNLARLSNLISEITSGDIQGDPANDLLQKFQAKEEVFRKIAETIDEAEGYLGIRTKSFNSMMGDLKSGMK